MVGCHTVFTTLRAEKTQTCQWSTGKVSRGHHRKFEPSTLMDAPDYAQRCEYYCQTILMSQPRGQVLFTMLGSSVSEGITEPDIKVGREDRRSLHFTYSLL